MLFGLMDPYILAGYLSAFAMVAACIVYGWLKREKGEG